CDLPLLFVYFQVVESTMCTFQQSVLRKRVTLEKDDKNTMILAMNSAVVVHTDHWTWTSCSWTTIVCRRMTTASAPTTADNFSSKTRPWCTTI
ncbi:unnamed protein product, partial [Ascophyllum nodosum]